MNGADLLCETLLANGIDTCFANPGTSEMHFVAALDRQPRIRCILGLFEGVVTGAADGYARMAEKPAATLLHTGPGLANALANMHNARRARTPMVNVVGDHASYHLKFDAPLTSDIDGLAAPMSDWVGRATDAETMGETTEAAIRAAMTGQGQVCTLILPADAAWSETSAAMPQAIALPQAKAPDAALVAKAAKMLGNGQQTVIFVSGRALRANALEVLQRIATKTGARFMAQGSNGRVERGAGRVAIERVPYPVDQAVAALAGTGQAILIGAKAPVGFFAYPGKPGSMLPEGCEILDMVEKETDLLAALQALAEVVGAGDDIPLTLNELKRPEAPAPGALTPEAVMASVVRHMPDQAIICDESVTSGRNFFPLSHSAPAHDFLQLTGGAIGVGIPMATGAAVACPERKVIGLQADGSGMYTLQALWTQAREQLDVVTVIFANRKYQILLGELKNVGANAPGENASRMLDLDKPELKWVELARGMGVDAVSVDTAEAFEAAFADAMTRKGPFLIEALI
ncbi:acetolactate synthase large subunit [Falsigemmobacter faecalis]|uniref:Acetolactate synthase large subunit n=1 Tax=Falsigemmobacter faecalis TaxID=2488730 RepID=A0A3P3DSU7_9RHOB|nr:acetolactate synthase large subunit [Falsigemmobacter faecalis]RRH76602.1 acetolactate synthase large subunit [Falsigemmobacter faecalis]